MGRKLVCGVGIMDADYIVDVREYWVENGKRKSRAVWSCPFHRKWSDMLVRCYSPKRLKYRQSYAGCYVCDEWLTFTNFKAWMEKQQWEGKHLDKDLLQTGNKVYSPETCVFVSAEVNSFLLERVSDRGEYPLGVVFRKRLGKYEACCSENGQQKYLGIFQTPEEAHQAWLTYKRKLAKVLAEQQDDPRVAEALIKRYENYNEGK